MGAERGREWDRQFERWSAEWNVSDLGDGREYEGCLTLAVEPGRNSNTDDLVHVLFIGCRHILAIWYKILIGLNCK